MPIGTAIGASAIIGGVATSKAAKSTSNAARDTAAQNNETQLAIYNQNRQTQQPFLNTGMQAMGAWASALGLGGAGQAQPQPQQNVGYNRLNLKGLKPWEAAQDLMAEGGNIGPMQYGAAQRVPNALSPAMTQQSAFDTYRNGLGYQTGLTEGMRALNLQAGNRGKLNSGAAIKDAIKFGQNYNQGFVNSYLDRLYQGTMLGAGAANALSGVGTNYANAVSANNNSALNATAQANAANANALGDMAGGIASGAAYYYGNRAPNALGSSYGGTNPQSIFSTRGISATGLR